MPLQRILATLSPALIALSVGCLDGKDDDDDDDDDDGDSGWSDTTGSSWTGTGTAGTTGTGGGAPSASVTWGSNSLELAVSGGPGAYWFGMAETYGDDGWTGEDCIYGYVLSDGTVLAWCHDGGDRGTSLTYGGNAYDLSAGTTVFPDESYERQVTYYLESDTEFGGNGSCYVWGHDTSYFAGLGCTEL